MGRVITNARHSFSFCVYAYYMFFIALLQPGKQPTPQYHFLRIERGGQLLVYTCGPLSDKMFEYDRISA